MTDELLADPHGRTVGLSSNVRGENVRTAVASVSRVTSSINASSTPTGPDQRPGTAADKIRMSQRSLSWRERATLVADEISLGCELLDRADAEAELGDASASFRSLESSRAACNSACEHLGQLSCLMQSHREILERSISRLHSAISEFRLGHSDVMPVPASDVIPKRRSILKRVVRAK
jgi:hypothetical protein